MKCYFVNQKKQRECVAGSEHYVKAKNSRLMLKCKCAECGIPETKFVKSSQSGGAMARYQGPSVVDKAAYVISNFVSQLLVLLASQKF